MALSARGGHTATIVSHYAIIIGGKMLFFFRKRMFFFFPRFFETQAVRNRDGAIKRNINVYKTRWKHRQRSAKLLF